MSLLFVVSNLSSAAILKGLAGACCRNQVEFLCFFTGAGIKVLADPEITGLLAKAKRAVVCEYSWEIYADSDTAPVETGSQTDHSAMIGSVSRVVSL